MAQAPSIFPPNLTIEECRASVLNFSGFRESAKLDHIIFNYDYAFRQSFPDPTQIEDPTKARLMSIRRECRGLIFHAATGKVLARRLHKFFNINEMDETQPEKIDLTQPHIILEKADGCLISPFICKGMMRWGTKLGVTDVTTTIEQDYLPAHPDNDFNGFSLKWMERGYTPIFEFCAAKHQVILEYPEDKLVCLAIRNNDTGNYIPFSQVKEDAASHNVPTVVPWPNLVFGRDYSNATELVAQIKPITQIEGFVIMFENGLMYKVKTDWYMLRSKQATKCAFFEKDIWTHVLNGTIDDYSDTLGPVRLERIGKFGLDLFDAIKEASTMIDQFVLSAQEKNMTKKDFKTLVDTESKKEGALPIWAHPFRGLFLKVFHGAESYALVLDYVKKHTSSSTKIMLVRDSICKGLHVSLNDARTENPEAQ